MIRTRMNKKDYIVQKLFHKPSSANIYMDVSESECNSDVQTNVITELKYDENIKPTLSVKVESYFNIFECVRNLLDQLDVMYQRAFTAFAKPSSVPRGHYEPSPAQERYYNLCADHIKEKNVGMDKDEIRKEISHIKYEDEE